MNGRSRRKPIYRWSDLSAREKQVVVLFTAGLTAYQCGTVLQVGRSPVCTASGQVRIGLLRAGTPAATKTELLKWLEAVTR
jgi:hypothetical protein